MVTTFEPLINLASARLAAPHAPGDGLLVLGAGQGPQFGSMFPFRVVCQSAITGSYFIGQITGRVGDTLALGAALEGTVDLALIGNDLVELRLTAGLLAQLETAITALESHPGQGDPYINAAAAKYSLPLDGTSDCYAALQAAFADLPGTGGKLFLPPGYHFRYNTPIDWSTKQFLFDMNGSRLDYWGGNTGAVVGTIIGATNAFPAVVNLVAHGLVTGQRIWLNGAVGNLALNGWWPIIRTDADHFSLSGCDATAAGAWTSGGQVIVMVPAFRIGGQPNTQAIYPKAGTRGLYVTYKGGDTSSPDFTLNGMIGVEVRNTQDDVHEYPWVEGFGCNWSNLGDGVGCTLGRTVKARLKGGGVQRWDFANNTAGTNGYVTERNDDEADYLYQNASVPGTNLWQYRSDVGANNGGSVAVSSSRFRDCSFQSFDAVPRFDLNSGNNVKLRDCRYESVNAGSMLGRLSTTYINFDLQGSTNAGLLVKDPSGSSPGNTVNTTPFRWTRLYIATSPAAITNSAAETSIIGSGNGTLLLPIYFWRRGKRLIFRAWAKYSTLAAGMGTLTLRHKLGSITIASAAIVLPASAASWRIEFECVVTHTAYGEAGAGRLNYNLTWRLQNSAVTAAAGATFLFFPYYSNGVALSDEQTMQLATTSQFSVADPAQTVTWYDYAVDQVD